MEIYKEFQSHIDKHRNTNTLRAFWRVVFKSLYSQFRKEQSTLTDGRPILWTDVWNGAFQDTGVPPNEKALRTLRWTQLNITENDTIHPWIIVSFIKKLCPVPEELVNYAYIMEVRQTETNIENPEYIQGVRAGRIKVSNRDRSLLIDHADDDFLRENWETLNLSPENILLYHDTTDPEFYKEFFWKIDNPEVYSRILDLIPGNGMTRGGLQWMTEDVVSTILHHHPVHSLTSREISTLVQCNISPSLICQTLQEHWRALMENNPDPNDRFQIYEAIQRIGYNPNITPEFIHEYLEFLSVDNKPMRLWRFLAANTRALPKILPKFPMELKEHRSVIALNRGLTIDLVINMQTMYGYRWDWDLLSSNPGLATPDVIKANLHLPWVWRSVGVGGGGISSNPSLTLEFITEFHSWLDFTKISRFNGLTYEFVRDTKEMFPWYFGSRGISSTSGVLTFPWICEMSGESWDWNEVVRTVDYCEETSACAIQSQWRLWRARRRLRELSQEVVEWWYSPDCAPGTKMRKGLCQGDWRED